MMNTGIREVLFAVAAEVSTARDWIRLCTKAADEAEAEAQPREDEYRLARPAVLLEAVIALEEVATGENASRLEVLANVARALITGQLSDRTKDSGAAIAFAETMPPLVNRDNIKAYIACVAVGMARGYITGKTASTMLYAAQAALTAHPRRVRRAAKPAPAKGIVGFSG